MVNHAGNILPVYIWIIHDNKLTSAQTDTSLNKLDHCSKAILHIKPSPKDSLVLRLLLLKGFEYLHASLIHVPTGVNVLALG